jgi:hypothetical protein
VQPKTQAAQLVAQTEDPQADRLLGTRVERGFESNSN